VSGSGIRCPMHKAACRLRVCNWSVRTFWESGKPEETSL
jgi:hypothetical protein